MSSIATSSSVSRESREVSRVSYVRVGLATVATAVLANTIFYFVASLFVHYDDQFAPLANVSGTIIFTVFPAILAVLFYAGLRKLTRRPVRIFAITSGVVLVLSVIPDLTYIPTVPGSTAAQTAILIAMHIIAAAVIVWTLSTYAGAEAR